MSLEKLQRTLKRELTRNPAKTGTLLALLPIAAYFIVPLLWKAVPKSSASAATPAQASFVAVNASSVPNVATAAPTVSWRELAETLAQDKSMQPTTEVGQRNPFQRVPTAAELAQAETSKQQEPAEVDKGPEEFGLQLTATIIGAEQRLATINGRLYRVDSEIKLRSTEDGGDVAPFDPFILREVNKNFVVLERRGQQYRLAIAK